MYKKIEIINRDSIFNIYNNSDIINVFKTQFFICYDNLYEDGKLILKKDNIYVLKFIKENIYSVYHYNYLKQNVTIFSQIIKDNTFSFNNKIIIKEDKIRLYLVPILPSITFKITQKSFIKDKKILRTFSFVDDDIFVNCIKNSLLNRFKYKERSLTFLDTYQNKQILDELFLSEQIPKLYSHIISNIYLLFRDIEQKILFEFIDAIFDVLDKLEKLCLKNKYFYPYLETTENYEILQETNKYLQNLYLTLKNNKTYKNFSTLENRKDFFLNLQKNSKIQRKSFIIKNEDDRMLIEELKLRNEFQKYLNNSL